MSAGRSVQLWDVYHLFAVQTNPPKPKFIIVTSTPPNASYVQGLFINSELNEFQQKPELEPCFVIVPVVDHPFLSYDSLAACGDVYTFTHAQLDAGRWCGRITPETAEAIRRGALACPILKRGHKRVFEALTLPRDRRA